MYEKTSAPLDADLCNATVDYMSTKTILVLLLFPSTNVCVSFYFRGSWCHCYCMSKYMETFNLILN